MGVPERPESVASLRDYLVVARRRKWIILYALVLVPAAAIAFSLTQQRLYTASSEVFLSRQNLGAALTGTPDPIASQQADRLAQTQANLARVPEVARRALEQQGAGGMTPESFLAASSVSAQQNADLLTLSVTDPSAARAQALASAYARAFTEYRRVSACVPASGSASAIQYPPSRLRASRSATWTWPRISR